MNVNNSGTEDGQENEQQAMQGPRAASERDVQEAELKAEEARERVAALEQALDEMQEDYEDLMERHEAALEVVDDSLEFIIEKAKFKGLVGSPVKKGSVKDDVEARVASTGAQGED